MPQILNEEVIAPAHRQAGVVPADLREQRRFFVFSACKMTGRMPPLAMNPNSCPAVVFPEKATMPGDKEKAMYSIFPPWRMRHQKK
jgi:hypothetical protein